MSSDVHRYGWKVSKKDSISIWKSSRENHTKPPVGVALVKYCYEKTVECDILTDSVKNQGIGGHERGRYRSGSGRAGWQWRLVNIVGSDPVTNDVAAREQLIITADELIRLRSYVRLCWWCWLISTYGDRTRDRWLRTNMADWCDLMRLLYCYCLQSSLSVHV